MPRLPLPDLRASLEDVLSQMATDAHGGLSSGEAARRLAEHGPNRLPRDPPVRALAVLGRQFMDVMVLVLLGAIGLSLLLGHGLEAAAIGAIAAFTVALGFFQEFRAAKAMAALLRLSAPHAMVLRDGQLASIDAAGVVPGDVIAVSQGDLVPADGRLLETVDLQAAEASLTGESAPVEKSASGTADPSQPVGDRTAMVHASTAIAYGRGRAVVVATGTDTEIGHIGRLLAGVKPSPTPMQRQLAHLARWLLAFGAAAVAAIVALGLLRGEPLGDMVLFGIAVAVAVVPEALPAVVTIALAIGAQRMARRFALIRRLPAVETLGGTTTICSDKTGTLTTGQMAVVQVAAAGRIVSVTGTGYEPKGLVGADAPADLVLELGRAAALCNDATLREEGGAWTVQGDPTEGALLAFAHKAGLDPDQTRAKWPRQAEVPFSSERKRMTTLHAVEGVTVAYSQGAPEAILASCAAEWTSRGPRPIDDRRRRELQETAERLATQGMRVLASARRTPASRGEAETGMELLGFLGMQDAPRQEAKEAIAVCHGAGIRPIMITGDHPLTAQAIAKELGILRGGTMLTGVQVESMDQATLAQKVKEVEVYARVSPAHKLRIVTALQDGGEIVAMTGDGVNDAPALRKADIGVAMGITGTDVAKEASAMTLADDNFATIVAAVEEGRAIHDNVRKFLMFLLSTNFGEILVIAATMLLGMPLPLTAVQILYVNLASDGLPALALAVDPREKGIMLRPPRAPRQALLAGPVVLLMAFGGVASALANLAVFAGALAAGKPMEEAMTMTFVSLVVIQLLKAYVFRSQRRSILQEPFTNRWLNLAVAWEIGLLLALVYVPFLQGVFGTYALTGPDWAQILAAAVAVVVVLELAKAGMRSRKPASHAPQT